MPSKLAEEISETVDSTTNYASLIDDDLSEVVEVLRFLSHNREGECWCWKPWFSKLVNDHDDQCRKAQAIWERLQDYA